MKKNYVGQTIAGLGAAAALTIGCAAQKAKQFTIDQYLSRTKIQAAAMAEDEKIDSAEIRDVAATYCLLHNKLKDGIANEEQKSAVEQRLDALGKIITKYVEKGDFEVYAYVDAKVDDVYRNRGGNAAMPARLDKAVLLEKAQFKKALGKDKDRADVRKKAEFLKRLQTAWINIQAGERTIDTDKFDTFYLPVTQESFEMLISESTDKQYGGRMLNGKRESAWTAEDHKEYFGEDRSDDRKGQMTAFGLVSESELQVDTELEKVIKAITESKKEEAEKPEEKPGVTPGTILVVDGKKVKVKSVNADGSYVTEPVKEEGAGEE